MKITRITFGVGFRSNDEPIADYGEVLDKLLSAVSLKHGGCSLAEGKGYWVDDSGDLVAEPCLILTVYHNSPKRDAYALACLVRSLFNQTAVMLEHDGVAEEVR